MIARIHALGTGNPDTVPCWTATCTGRVTAGAYKCANETATYYTWTPLNYGGVKRWVADRCVTLGRIA
ncbi:hypothetical protein GCM10010222_78840 [Streptomyces tanashiensis]|nr:hypothetical protein GCM10010222_78840 [Streptomyces tanashiensis]